MSSSTAQQNRVADRRAGQCIGNVHQMDHHQMSLDNKENYENHSSSNVVHEVVTRQVATLGEAKKIEISEDEKSMNGAPAGDLFDLSVHPDEELTSFIDDTDALMQLRRVCLSLEHSKLWVEKFERVLIIRRICLHHADSIISNDLAALTQALAFVIDEAESLRSCNVRNAVLCLKSMIAHCGQLFSTNHENCCSVVSILLLRSVSSPRFLMDMAFSTLSIAVTALDPSAMINCLVNFSTHKNNEISANAIMIAVDCINHHYLSITKSGSDPERRHDLIGNTIRILFAGLNSKRIKAKEGAIALLRRLMDSFTCDESFLSMINSSLSPAQRIHLNRCMSLNHRTTQRTVAEHRRSSRGLLSTSTPASIREHVLQAKLKLQLNVSHTPEQSSASCSV